MTTSVEVKFDGSIWTDVKAYVRRLTIGRGRVNDLSAVDPGTLTVELDNNDGRFTPTNTQSPYSPNVKPAVEVRVTVNAGAGPDNYRLFTGKAQRWEPRWDVGGRPLVVLEAVDGFEQLANANIRYAHRHTVMENSPSAYWPLGDSSVTLRDRSAPRRDLRAESNATVGEGSLVTGGQGAVSTTGGNSSVFLARPPASWYGASNDVTFSGWLRFDTNGGDRALILDVQAPSGPIPGGWTFQITAGRLELQVRDGVTADTLATTALTWTEGVTYHVGFWWDQSAGQVTFYRDGVSVGTDTTTLSPTSATNGTLSGVSSVNVSSVIRFCEFALWTSDQSSLMSDLYDSGRGFASDLPGARITRILDWAGWDASARDIDVGTTPLAAVDAGSALDACRDAAAADGGVFFIDAEGNATFQGRRNRWEDPAAIDYSDRYVDTYGGTVVDFDDDGTDTGYQTVGWRFDTTLLANRVVVNSNTQGTSDGVAEDSTSRSAYGLRALDIPTVSNNSADNAQRAQWELSRRKDPHLRLEEVGFLVADTVQEDAAGSLELQSLVEVNRRPGSGQDDLSVQMRVASIDHTFSDGGSRWDARFGLLEADTDQPGLYGTAVYGADYYGY